MAHLGTSYSSFEKFVMGAKANWAVDLTALNNSGAFGTAVISAGKTEGTPYLNVSILAEGLTPDMPHAQHIHGTFDDDGAPSDARLPTLAEDTDGDGFVEVLEGVATYGDILLSLLDGNGAVPEADGNGQLAYVMNFEPSDMALLKSPVTGIQYEPSDLLPLMFREIVIHGQNVEAGYGAGTDGEIDGTQDGFVGILPTASGEITRIDKQDALEILAGQRADASIRVKLSDGDDTFQAGLGDDMVRGLAGDDVIFGGADDDVLRGNAGDDRLDGGEGHDILAGGRGADLLAGGDGSDVLRGKQGADTLLGNRGADSLHGGDGDDRLLGNRGRDELSGGEGADVLAGGRHDDMLTGGAGADVFAFVSLRDGNDIVTDFEDGTDILDFSRVGIDMDDLEISQMGEDTHIAYGRSELVLRDTDASQIGSEDFIL